MISTTYTDTIGNKILDFLKTDLHIDLENDDFNIPKYIPKANNLLFNKTILILSGGGIKGISFIGALKALHDHKLLDNITTYVGASVGTIIILLYMIGYTPDDLLEFIKCFDLGKLKCIDPLLILDKYGLDDGSRIERTLKKLMENRNVNPNITLKNLYNITKKKFITTTVSLSNMMPVYMSYENFPDLEVCTAIRMSISIPFIFTPVMYNKDYYVDGGCIDNFPFHLYKNQMDEVLGLCLVESHNDEIKINNLEEYIAIVIKCIISGITFNSIKDIKENIIQIKMPKINATAFDISDVTKITLFNIGYETIMNIIMNM